MRTYRYARLIVDGKETAALDIYKEHNTFTIYHNGETMLVAGYTDTKKYIDAWEGSLAPIKEFLKANGHEVRYERNALTA